MTYRFHYLGEFTGNPYYMDAVFSFEKDGSFANELKVKSLNLPFVTAFRGRDSYTALQWMGICDPDNQDADMRKRIRERVAGANWDTLFPGSKTWADDLSKIALVMLEFESEKRERIYKEGP